MFLYTMQRLYPSVNKLNVNIWNIYFELRMKDQIEERSSQLLRNLSSCEKKAWKKNSGLIGIRTHDLCDASAVLYQLNCHNMTNSQLAW